MPTLSKDQLKHILVPLIAITLILQMVFRIFLGVDLTDESYHIATAYHFFKGARAFVDELYIIQTFAFVTTPIFSLLMDSQNSLDGIILKMRMAFLVYQLLIVGLFYLALKKQFSSSLSLLSALFYFIYVPMNIFSLFYVTLGVGFLAMGSVVLFLTPTSSKPGLLVCLAGIFLALSTISHPVMFLPSLYLSGLLFYRSLINQKIRLAFLFGVVFLGIWLLTMYGYQFSPVDYLKSFQGFRPVVWNLQRIIFALTDLVVPGPVTYFLLAWFVLFIYRFLNSRRVNHRLLSWTDLALILSFPALIFLQSRASQTGVGPCGYVMLIFYFSPFLCHAVTPTFTKNFLCSFWVPALLAAIGMSFASLSGPSSTSAGFLLVLPFGIAFLLQTLEKIPRHFPLSISLVSRNLLYLSLLFIFLRALWGSTFGEIEMANLSRKIESGPFQGLKTTPNKEQFVTEIQTTLASTVPSQGHIVFSCFFPAGYLMTSLTPAHTMLHTAPDISSINSSVDVVVRLYDAAYPKLQVWQQQCQPLPERISKNQGTILRKEEFEIWIRTPSKNST